MENKQKEPILYRIMRPAVTFLIKNVYRPKIINAEVLPKDGACVIAGNHKFIYDPLLVDSCTKRTVYALCAAKYYYADEWFYKSVGSIPVDSSQGKLALMAAVDHLKQGHLINVSPEGKRNLTDELLLPFKKGAVVMAKRANCKIIPYSITGDYRFFGTNLVICFGEPIDVSNMEVEEANALLYERIKNLMVANGDRRKNCSSKNANALS